MAQYDANFSQSASFYANMNSEDIRAKAEADRAEKAAENAATHDILTQTELTGAEREQARMNINAAEKAAPAVAGNIAALSANGDPVDSGIPADDAQNNVFVATYGVTTLEELNAAQQAKKILFCVKTDGTYLLSQVRQSTTLGNIYVFSKSTSSSILWAQMYGTNGWIESSTPIVVAKHASNHAAGGTDPITPASIGAEKAHGTLSLVETITVDQAVSTIRRYYADEDYYAFFITMRPRNGGAVGDIRTVFYADTARTKVIGAVQIDGAIPVSGGKSIDWYAYTYYGKWNIEGMIADERSRGDVQRAMVTSPRMVVDFPSIKAVQFMSYTDGVPIPVGTEIQLYGVMA